MKRAFAEALLNVTPVFIFVTADLKTFVATEGVILYTVNEGYFFSFVSFCFIYCKCFLFANCMLNNLLFDMLFENVLLFFFYVLYASKRVMAFNL